MKWQIYWLIGVLGIPFTLILSAMLFAITNNGVVLLSSGAVGMTITGIAMWKFDKEGKKGE